jgi:type IV pilus assembly protein PilB
MIEEIINRVERKRLLGAALLADGLVSEQQLDQALERQQQTGAFLGETLIELGHVVPSILGKYVEERINYPFVELTGTELDFEAARSIPERIARRKMVLPFGFEDDGVRVAMADPLDLGTVDELKSFFSKPILPHLAFAADVTESINRAFDVRHKAASALRDIADIGPTQLEPGSSINSETLNSNRYLAPTPTSKLAKILSAFIACLWIARKRILPIQRRLPETSLPTTKA